MINSKFKIRIFLIIILFSISLTFQVLLSFDFFGLPIPLYFLYILLTFTNIWLFFGEMRMKIISLELNNSEIVIRRYFGLYKKEVFNYNEFEGFKISLLPGNEGFHEYLYLMKENKNVIKISDFYHKNYFEIKNELSKKIKDLGIEKFSYSSELKEIFK